MWYLGWDCANRTLAFVLMKFDRAELDAVIAALDSVTTREELTKLRERARKIIEIRRAEVIDLLGDKIENFTSVQLARKLGDFLDSSAVSVANLRNLRPQVVIEYQPPKLARWGGATTGQASTIAHQLMFYYREFEVAYIDSKEKNKIAVSRTLQFERYTAGCDTEARRKSARKKHTTDNFLFLLENFHSDAGAIKKSLANHAADACMQIFAFVAKAR